MKPANPNETAKFWFDPQLNNLELLRATYHKFAFAPHAHDTYAIGITESGAQTFTHRRSKNVLMPAGSVAVVHPGEIHTSQAANSFGWSYRMFYPGAGILQQVASELAGHPCELPSFPSPVIQDAVLARHIHNFHIADESMVTSALERETRLLEVLELLIQRHAVNSVSPCTARVEPDYIRRICQYLEDNFADAVALEQLAGLVDLSPFHLLRVFRNTTGFTPHIYLIHIRIKRAKQFLRKGMPLASVAAETGFVDQSHFSKYFKRVVGISPGQYR